MQDPKTSKTRKPWYQRAIAMTTPWKTTFWKIPLTPTNSTTTINLWKTLKSTETQPQNSSSSSNNNNNNTSKQKLRKCTSLKVATSFTRVCLCAPISSYTEVFNTEVLPRRSYSYPRSSKPLPTATPATLLHHHHPHQLERVVGARLSVEGRRRVFRGKSLMDDVLMRRFVIEEEAMVQVRRRNEIEIIRKRAILRRKRLGPSPLSRMSMAQDLQVYGFQDGSSIL